MSRRTPVVSLGQGDYRRDYDRAEDFRLIPWLLFFAAIVLISLGAIALDHMNQPSGVRANDTHTPAQTANSGALGS
jgi:hypothetical protein